VLLHTTCNATWLQQKAIVRDLKRVGKDRRGYEQMQEVIVTVEPFTIARGLMTQTLKVRCNIITTVQ
jgi:long-subunit acyl-CoA synthetase (AMP-forming)